MLLGIIAIWIATGAVAAALVGYARACLRETRELAAVGANGHANGANGHANGSNGHGNGKKGRVLAPSPAASLAPKDSLASPRRWFIFSALSVFTVAAVLMTMVLGRHYELAYIWGHSGNDLPLHFRFASFWAGQEGTFVLWSLYGSILGLLLIRKAGDYERWVMPFFCGIQLFLLAVLCVMSPFRLHDLSDAAKQMALPEGFHIPATFWERTLYYFGLAPALRPIDGMGLNITLQNFWMVIHPPIIFVGFSVLAIPGRYALAALVRRDYDTWVTRAASWTIFGWMTIGFGKFLGGYWAYETLGWGGYWAWDPVENTSMVPWIFGTALIHGMLVQRARGSLKHANLFLAILTFLSVLYGTFLTRSGALSEFSVHSFTSPALAVYVMMLGFMGLWGIGGFGLLARRFAEIRSESAYDRLNERPFGFFLGVILLIGAGTVVCVGMSWPLISPMLMGKAASLKFDFYNRAMLPIATFICLLLSVTPHMVWRKTGDRPAKPVQKALTVAAALILLLGIPAGALAWHGGNFEIQKWLADAFRIPESLLKPDTGFSPAAIPALVVFSLAALLGIVANSIMIARTARGGILQTGAWVSHVALCISFIGVVISSVFSSGKELVLVKGEKAEAHGYQVTYQGIVEPTPPELRYLKFQLSRTGETFETRLPYFEHGMGGQKQDITRPVIRKYFGQDLYLASGGWTDGRAETQVAQGETAEAMGYRISLKAFKHEGMENAGGKSTQPLTIRPVLEVSSVGSNEMGGRSATLSPAFTIHPDGRVEQERVALPGGAHEIVVARVLVPGQDGAGETPAVKLALAPRQPVDMVKLEISTKPGINLVWLGGYLMLFGAFLAYRRRATVANLPSGTGRAKKVDDAAPAEAPTRGESEPVLHR